MNETDDLSCEYPNLSPSYGYKKGCRCPRCNSWRREYDINNRRYANKRRRAARAKARGES